MNINIVLYYVFICKLKHDIMILQFINIEKLSKTQDRFLNEIYHYSTKNRIFLFRFFS